VVGNNMALQEKVIGSILSNSVSNECDFPPMINLSSDYKNHQELAQEISFESALFGIMMLFQRNKDFISIVDSVLIVKESNKHLLEKLSYFLEVLCNVPFTFEFDSETNEYYYDFHHVLEEIQLVMKLDFN
jgi:hypothetical protein